MPALHLHHLQNSRSFRIVWLLEELNLPYQLTSYERRHGLAPKSLQRIHPLGKAPILQDADKTLVESAVIIEHLIDNYDQASPMLSTELLSQRVMNKQFRPDYGTEAYSDYRYWLHFTESSLMPLLILRLAFATVVKKSPIGIKQVAKLLKKGVESSYIDQSLALQLDLLDKHLGRYEWLAGTQFTGADVQLEFAINALVQSDSLPAKYANVHNWLKKCQARPAYQQAIAKGGKVQF